MEVGILMVIVIYIIVCVADASPSYYTPDAMAIAKKVARGMEDLEALRTQITGTTSDTASLGCWRSAVSALVEGCRAVISDDDEKSKLAVQLANCHLQKSGRKTYACGPKYSVEQCTKL